MTDFKLGDRVLVGGTVIWLSEDGVHSTIEVTGGAETKPLLVRLDGMQPAPEPPYVDPELVPGMVVGAEDESDDRTWWVAEDPYGHAGFRAPDDIWFSREQLPAEIRPVFDPRPVFGPREVSS